ncbi:MAG: biotin transporter BioY [Bacillota bacterium]|nr:biotin transporter BioY [Bacillota bacterium]
MNTTYSKSNAVALALCGLFAALTVICSWISVPLGFTPIPVNLATLAVFLAGGLLGPKYGTTSMIVYTLLGAVGIPVFAGFRGGVGVLAGPTGGYIIGYILAALIIGLLLQSLKTHPVVRCVVALICGLATCYALGTAWFMISTNTGFVAAMLSCVVPFLLGDALKIIAATILILRLRKHITAIV